MKTYNEWSLYMLHEDFIINAVYVSTCTGINGISYSVIIPFIMNEVYT